MAYSFECACTLLEHLGIDTVNVNYFGKRISKITADSEYNELFRSAVEKYQADDSMEIDAIVQDLNAIAERFKENQYTIHFLFLLANTHWLHERYLQAGISDEIYYCSMDDLRCKLSECIECKGVPGTFVVTWFGRFFRVSRFGLGRFQFETIKLECKGGFTSSCGFHIEDGTTVLNIHIPSSGIPLTDEVRFDSYRRAREFYRNVKNTAAFFRDGPTVFHCSSWLLYDKQREFLPVESNILKFLNDFELISSGDSDNFGNAWRVFGHWASLPAEMWPKDTKLRAAYANRILSGGKTGSGRGVILFNGDKILR
ncbi:MAG: acyltransferase domain-containing protein [Eubacteriales bacterium]